MPLNSKKERLSRLAHELARLTGDSITAAVETALEARLAELRRQSGSANLARDLLAIGQKCAAQAPPDWRTRDFDRELYDDRGPPR